MTGRQLAGLRAELKVNGDSIARALGIFRATLVDVECGRVVLAKPTNDEIAAVVKLLAGVPVVTEQFLSEHGLGIKKNRAEEGRNRDG